LAPSGVFTPTLQKPEGFKGKASEGEVVVLYFEPSGILRRRINSGFEVLRLSPWVNNMAKNDPILRIHRWGYPGISHYSMISEIISDHYLPFAMLFMQLRGLLN